MVMLAFLRFLGHREHIDHIPFRLGGHRELNNDIVHIFYKK